jgi:hypothetical protein
MAVFRNKSRSEFVTVANGFIGDSGISAGAKVVLIYLWSKPYDWEVYVTDIVKHMKEGRDSVYKSFRELLDLGYIHRRRRRMGASGRFHGYHYDVYGEPFGWIAKEGEGKGGGVDALADLAAHELKDGEFIQ